MAYNEKLSDAIFNNDITAIWELIYESPEYVKCDIPFDPEWNNDTGYYNGAVKADLPQLEVGEIGRSRSPAPNNRRLLIVKTPFGNVVLFERFTPTQEKSVGLPIVFNMPDEVRISEMIGTEGAMSVDQLLAALGDNLRENVGRRLEYLLEVARFGRKTKRGRFAQMEAFLVASMNIHRVVDVMLMNTAQEDAVIMLTQQQFITPELVRAVHVNHSIPYNTDGTGIQAGNDVYYKLSEGQAKAVLKLTLTDLLDQKSDELEAEYAKLAESIIFVPAANTSAA